jgi:hypothetical protein
MLIKIGYIRLTSKFSSKTISMRKLFALLIFTTGLTSAVLAKSDVDPNGDPDPKEQNTKYTFSLSNAYFAIFNLFSVEPTPTDSLKMREEYLPLLPDTHKPK